MQSENSKNTNSKRASKHRRKMAVADDKCLEPRMCKGKHKKFEPNEEFLKNAKKVFRNQRIKVVNTVQECEDVVNELRSHCGEYNVLGFDCEWVSQYSRQKVALLQLASHRGLCALIRLSKLKGVPKKLRQLLQDKSILKVGIQPHVDEGYLIKDYGISHIASTLDIRYLARDSGLMENNDGLAKLSETHLKVQLNKNRCINSLGWRDKNLLPVRIEYAANDVHASIELFKVFQMKLKPISSDYKQKTHIQDFIKEYCVKHLNKKNRWAFNPPKIDRSREKKSFNNPTESVGNPTIHIVANVEECQIAVNEIKSHCSEYNVLGYKMLTVQSTNNPNLETFDILQLATHRGLCAIFYLKYFKVIPVELKNLLLDKHILKVGVEPIRRKYNIHIISTLDLNFLLNEYRRVNGQNPTQMRLPALCRTLLDVKLNETPDLALKTIEKNYETNDAHITFEIFKKLTEKMKFNEFNDDQQKNLDKFIRQNCFKYLDIEFEESAFELDGSS